MTPATLDVTPATPTPTHPWSADAFQVYKYGTRYYQDKLGADDRWPEWTDPVPGFTSLKPSKPFRKSITVGDDKLTVPLDTVAPYEWLLDQPIRALTDPTDFARQFFGSVAAQRDRNFARGYAVHAAAEAALLCEPYVRSAWENEDARPYLAHVVEWIENNVKAALAVEAVVFNRTIKYGGTGDAWVILNDGEIAYVDWKSRGADSKHDIYEEEIMQGGAYTGADYMIAPTPDRTAAMRVDVPQASVGIVVSIRPDGVQEFRYDLGKAQDAFREMAAAYHATSRAGKLARAAKTKVTTAAPLCGVYDAYGQCTLPKGHDGGHFDLACARAFAETNCHTCNRELPVPVGAPGEPICDDCYRKAREAIEGPPATLTPADQFALLNDRPDEGGPHPDADFEALQRAYSGLSGDGRDWIARLRDEAVQRNVDFHSNGNRTVRRYHIIAGLVALAGDLDGADEIARAVTATIIGDPANFANVTVGHAVGSLDASQAATFADRCRRVVTQVVPSTFDDAGRLTLRFAS